MLLIYCLFCWLLTIGPSHMRPGPPLLLRLPEGPELVSIELDASVEVMTKNEWNQGQMKL